MFAIIAIITIITIIATINAIAAKININDRANNELKAFDEFVESLNDGCTASVKCHNGKIIVNGKSFEVNDGYWTRFYNRIHTNSDTRIANCRVYIDNTTNEIMYDLGREGYEF